MSTNKNPTRFDRAEARQRTLNLDVTTSGVTKALQDIEVTALQLDESYDGDCDPYNCTGKFLVDAARSKRGD